MSDISEEKNVGRSGNESPEQFNPRSEVSSGYFSSSPATPSVSPPHTLKRSRSSTFRLIDRRISTISNSSQISIPQEPEDCLAALIGWYPALLIRVSFELFGMLLYVGVRKLPFVLPTLWISGWLWLFWKCVFIPLNIVKGILIFISVPLSERRRKKRTILISGGSTVQTIHLARNFYSAGSRVVVCEVEGHFGLARFSTAVQSYYTLPKPNGEQRVDDYIEALKDIVIRENAEFYIPVSETIPAYYDALAKPQMEELGCQCICPDLRDVLLLDDTLEMMRKVQSENLVSPVYYFLQSNSDLKRVYDNISVRNESHILVKVGLSGCKNRKVIKIPAKKHVKAPSPLNEQNPWLLIQECKGTRYVTCTTLKDSKIIANVICKVDNFGGLIPVELDEIENWLKQFFDSLKFNRKIVGHVSFFFIVTEESHVILTGSQVGVKKPYICYTSNQSRIVCKPCKHFRRDKSGPIVINGGKYWLNQVMFNTIGHPTFRGISKLFEIFCGQNDALFSISDPLPYCAYYYLQLPLNSLNNIYKKFVTQ